MKIEIIVPGAILFSEQTQHESAYAFMRLQEFYENADISRQGKFYTLDETIEHYAKNGGSATSRNVFTYLQDWAGFNVPGHVVDKFIKMYKHDFTKREAEMFDALDKVIKQEEDAKTEDGKYYIIGSCSDIYVDHELCHALWYLYPDFKKDALKLMKKFPKEQVKSVHTFLLDAGYATNVLDDEFNAYISTNTMYDTMEDCFEHLTPAQKRKVSWDKIYKLVENFWEWKHDLMREEEEIEIVLK